MALFRTVNGVVFRFNTDGDPITDMGGPRPGPTIWELGGPDGSSPETGPIAPAPESPAAAGFARLFVDVTDAETGGAFVGATVLSASAATGNQTHATDARGTAVLTAAIGEDIEVNVVADGYGNVDQVVHIFDADDHRLGVALQVPAGRRRRQPVPTTPPELPAASAPDAPAPSPSAPASQPPGIPPEIVLQPGQIGELEAPTLHAGELALTPPYTRAAFETRDGVPSITADSFSALEIGSVFPSPVGIFASIISGILGLFKGSSGSADVSRLSTIVQNIGDLLLKTVSTVADLAARSVHTDTQAAGLFSHILGGVLGPIINALAAVIRGGSSDLGKLFGPVTETLKKIIGVVKHLYDVWLRPIIKAIDTARQLLKILETFHVKWAAEADAALGRLEAKLSAPLLQTIQQLNTVSNVVNRIVTLDGALQRATLVQSMYKHQTCVQRAIDQAPMAEVGTYRDKLPAPAADMTVDEWRAGLLGGLPS